MQQNAAKFTIEIHSKLHTESRVKNKVIWHNIRPHRRRTWTAQSCSPGGANVHPICTVPVLPPAELLELYWLLDMSWASHFSLNISLHVWGSRFLGPVWVQTRRPASADRTARRQFQATGQPVSRTQASDAMTSLLPRCEAKCVQRRCFQCGSVPLRSDIKGMEQPLANILIPLERQLLCYNFATDTFYIMLIFALDKLNIRHISTSGLVDLLT